ncbi:hypothetical protein HELRODRAFT_98767 [Helobdella robusta]|uniref:Protein kinase domain-containing protein n=1 Tax=Helobdella robusta TaxID=6412 RepID=T1G9P6_HELRO|nr:hypothetical protein HELRODRAFT_98767 [Helobdella robusta]ESO06815.1 hypothetical protein HELRODRAFT_98767 [Helobdella robusta]
MLCCVLLPSCFLSCDVDQLGRTIGQGTFGKVIVAFDNKKKDKKVAIKVVKKDEADYEDAVLEAKIIEKMQKIDDGPNNLCIRVLDWFDYYGHFCIVFDMLGHSIYEFMRRNNFQPFIMSDVQKISYRLCGAVKFCHDQGLAHTDLKPENILFVSSKFNFTTVETCHKRGAFRQICDSDIRLIDFGSAVFEEDHSKGLVSTRHYRAPEVILELGWSFPCDVWSVGCIIFEIYYGRTLFQTHDTMEHLAMMERVLGRIPTSMREKSIKTKYFKHGRLDWNEGGKIARRVRERCRPLMAYMRDRSTKEKQLFDLMSRMLEYRPEKRITMREALKHEFFDDLK